MAIVFNSIMLVVGGILLASEAKAKHACKCEKGE